MSNIYFLGAAPPSGQIYSTLEKAVSLAIGAMNDAQITNLMKSPIAELRVESLPAALAA